ncbi:STAS domain-containing protein [Acidovorax sp.]|uniref:STAS domain-containing protein n=1 Tax=Acidovorax sp. TaxID=1872122 RepID=UPI00391F6676
MSKEDSNPGLLSKVVRFVRNPSVSWADLESRLDDRESEYSKQMLKEMIERKRRNDFVRRREFDELRNLRKREAIQGQRTEDPGGRPSFFQSSMASPNERAVTLKKINEIEAQMSQQWWKGKQSTDEASGQDKMPVNERPADRFPDVSESVAASARAFAPTAPASMSALLQSKPAVQPLFADDSMSVANFGGGDASMVYEGADGTYGESAARAAPSLAEHTAPMALSEPEEFVHEPDLEEAAIRFANGDHAGAETGLLEVLAQHQHDAPDDQMIIWMTLFDLYRATGQHDRFESLAMDFAAQYSRSAPLWFSMPGLLGLADPAAAASVAAPGAVQREFSWNAPASVAVSSVAALQASLARTAAPWTLSWSRLASIDEAAVPLLADQFTRWAEREGQFVFSGVERLIGLLGSKTQSGDRSTSPEWWRLRMASLRLMGNPEEFELVALDYCVTYEVSPPSWMPPRCGYADDRGVPSGSASQAEESDFGPSSMVDSIMGTLDRTPVAELAGYIEGDAVPMLEPFEAFIRPGVPLTISCDKLIRVDFGAAGSVLNWAAARQSEGHVIQFQNLQRLVAVFYNVIGINEHARIIPRKN